MESLKNISQSSTKKSPLTLKRKRKSSSPKRKSSLTLKRKRKSSSPKRKSSSPKKKSSSPSPIKSSSKKNFEKQFEIITTYKKILNVEGITQINLEGKLITIIGEWHSVNTTKLKPTINNITIDQFILERIKNNDKIKIMLEYVREVEDVNHVQSININLIYNTLLNNRYTDKIFPFDRRYYFLNKETYFNYLFTDIEFPNTDFISNTFIIPYYNYSSYFTFDHALYNKQKIDFLNEYLKSIDINLKTIFDDIHKEKYNTIKIKSRLILEWVKVCDFFILTEILKDEDKISEYIILVGDVHKRHLEDIFKKQIVANTNNGNLSGLYYDKNKLYGELNEMASSQYFLNKTKNLRK